MPLIFLPLNENLLIFELFGHIKDAFTDATICYNQITDSYHGIGIMRSRNCLVAKNTASGAEWNGILLFKVNSSIVRDNRNSVF